MKLTRMAIEQPRSDGMGPRYAVRMEHGEIDFEANGGIVTFPSREVDWLIGALERIRRELPLLHDATKVRQILDNPQPRDGVVDVVTDVSRVPDPVTELTNRWPSEPDGV